MKNSAKSLLRQEIRGKILSMPAAEAAAADRRICDNITALPCWQQASSIFAYFPMAGEIDIFSLLEKALMQGKELYLPRIKQGNAAIMEAARSFALSELQEGRFGIPTPPPTAPVCCDPDLIIIPGLAFDPRTHLRLGRGGGYYDRWLSATNGCGILLAPARTCQLVNDLPADVWDQVVHIIVTETAVFD